MCLLYYIQRLNTRGSNKDGIKLRGEGGGGGNRVPKKWSECIKKEQWTKARAVCPSTSKGYM